MTILVGDAKSCPNSGTPGVSERNIALEICAASSALVGGGGLCYTRGSLLGAWLSLVERSVRDREAAGSNPVAPTT